MSELTHMNECYSCIHKRGVPGNCHIRCAMPSANVRDGGDPHGIRNGWFRYPLCFDPVWKGEERCENFEAREEAGDDPQS